MIILKVSKWTTWERGCMQMTYNGAPVLVVDKSATKKKTKHFWKYTYIKNDVDELHRAYNLIRIYEALVSHLM